MVIHAFKGAPVVVSLAILLHQRIGFKQTWYYIFVKMDGRAGVCLCYELHFLIRWLLVLYILFDSVMKQFSVVTQTQIYSFHLTQWCGIALSYMPGLALWSGPFSIVCRDFGTVELNLYFKSYRFDRVEWFDPVAAWVLYCGRKVPMVELWIQHNSEVGPMTMILNWQTWMQHLVLWCIWCCCAGSFSVYILDFTLFPKY